MTDTPYASHLDHYTTAGWSGVLPLPAKAKKSPPDGFTGYDGAYPSVIQLDEWRAGRAAGNIALRMPDGVIGIDVDAYGSKPGRATLEALAAQHGELPRTWISTSRDDGISGIRFYRVPEGVKLIGSLPGIEIIQRHHRYAVVAPSIHPEGREYRWISDAGEEVPDEVPVVDDLPFLPDAWLTALRADTKTSGDRRRIATGHEVAPAVDRAYGEAMRGMSQGTRHDSTLAAVTTLVRLEDLGYPGASDTLDRLGSDFTNAVTADGSRKPSEADAEFDRMVESASAVVASTPAIAQRWEDRVRPKNNAIVLAGPTSQPTAPWDDPHPLPAPAAPPAFPVDTLPAWAQAHAATVADQVQVPVDLTGMQIIGSLSAAATGRATVAISPDWSEPVNLYLVTAMRSGAGKSPADKYCVRWLRDWQRERIAAIRVQYDDAMLGVRHAKKKLSKLEGGMGEMHDLLSAVADVRKAEADVPVLPRLLIDDATPEAVAGVMLEHGQSLAIVSTEADLFDMLLKGKPGQRQNMNLYLKAWSGDEFTRDRKGGSESGPEWSELSNPLLTVAVTVQPSVLAKIQGDEELASRGFTARFMFSLPEDMIGHRDQRKRFGAQRLATTDAYVAEARALADRWASWQHPATLRMEPAAAQLLEDFLVEVEPRLAAGADLEHLGEWANKLHGSIPRYAGLLHLAEGGRSDDPVTAETTARAIELGRYWLGHAVAVMGLAVERVVEQAEAVLEWVASNGAEFTPADLQKHLRRPALGFDKVLDYVPALELLESLGWIRSLEAGDWRANIGVRRSKSPDFAVWPNVVGKPQSARIPRNRSTAYKGERETTSLSPDVVPPLDPRGTRIARTTGAPPIEAEVAQQNPPPVDDDDEDGLF